MTNNLKPGYRNPDAGPRGYQTTPQRPFDGSNKAYVAALEREAANAAQNIVSRYSDCSPEFHALMASYLAEQAKNRLAQRYPNPSREQPRDEYSGRYVPRNTGEVNLFEAPPASGMFNNDGSGGNNNNGGNQ